MRTSQRKLKYGFASIELLYSIVIFGVIGIACANSTLSLTKYFYTTSIHKRLDSQIALLKIQNLLSSSVALELSSTSAEFYLIDRQRLFGYGTKDFQFARFAAKDSGLLLPQVPLEILQIQDKTLFLASHLPNTGYKANEKIALICRDPNSQVIEQIAEIKAANNKTIELDSAPLNTCKVILPLEQQKVRVHLAQDKIFFNGEALLDSVTKFAFKMSHSSTLGEMVEFLFCQNHRCFKGASFVAKHGDFVPMR